MKGFRITSLGAVICITLVLFFLGMMGRFLIFSYYLKEDVRQDIGFNAFLQENADSLSVQHLMSQLKTRPEVKSLEYISKDRALRDFVAEGNENPTEVLDYNPLPSSIHIYVVDSFVDKNKLASLTTFLQQQNVVNEVRYAEDFLSKINENIRRVTLAMSFILLLLLIVSFVLIDNTIRLSMMNNRFIIKTMQYAGAANFSIAFPYLRRSIFEGIVSGIIAMVIINIANIYIKMLFPEWAALSNHRWELLLYATLVCIGMGLAFLSTLASVYKYLRTASSKLY